MCDNWCAILAPQSKTKEKKIKNAKVLNELEEKAVCGGAGPYYPDNNPNDDPEAERKANEEFLNSLPDLFAQPKNKEGDKK